MSWEPSVRTLHLAVIIILVIMVTGAFLCFNIASLINDQIAPKENQPGYFPAATESFADLLYTFSQRAINNRPLEEPQVAIGLDEGVRSMLKASTGKNKDFVYCAMESRDGNTRTVIAQSDPFDILQTVGKVKPIEELQEARWYRQLWLLYQEDNVYELKIPLVLNKKHFADIVTGVQSSTLRARLSPTIKLSLAVGFIIVCLGVLVALLSSSMVLWPLREVMESVEQLEAESTMQTEPRPVNVEMQSIAQRLRELGRRFAGNRTEIDAIRDQLQQVVGSLSERVLLLDRERRVIMASPEAERMLSAGHVPLRGQRLADVLSMNHPITSLAERAYNSGQSLQEVTTLNVNGSKQQQAIVASLQLFEDRGQPAGALLTLRDFETLQRLETQLDFATKLAALNRITAGVAHEVKNPLHAMVLHLELLGAKLDAGLDPKPHVDILMSEVNRLKRVVLTFLDFTRPVELKLHQVDANVLVREVVLLAADARAQGIDLEEHYGGNPLIIKADTDLLKQALLNIIINGCQVMPKGGRLIVETGRDDGQVFISITDHGPGIPEDARDKIFNLYYTTKPKGSGIGLAQAFRAVQLHNGRIKVLSEVGEGTSFKIILPSAN
ncbi:MAG: PAS domain-containing protein [Blastocatellia bacterium]|nr:PAS domain-containing protein [Blastocatellia bacterium]